MKQAISRITAHVNGTRRGVALAPGTVIDLDEIVGDTDGQPLTLEQALGPNLVAGCDLVPSAALTADAGNPAPRSHHQPSTKSARTPKADDAAAGDGE